MPSQISSGSPYNHANRSEDGENLVKSVSLGIPRPRVCAATYKRRHYHVLIPPIAGPLEVSGVETKRDRNDGQYGEEDRHNVHLPWSLAYRHLGERKMRICRCELFATNRRICGYKAAAEGRSTLR